MNSTRKSGTCQAEIAVEHDHSPYLEQIGPEVVDKVDDQTLDVGAVLVLIRHDHQLAVAQTLD